jgi:hypothetical protein
MGVCRRAGVEVMRRRGRRGVGGRGVYV